MIRSETIKKQNLSHGHGTYYALILTNVKPVYLRGGEEIQYVYISSAGERMKIFISHIDLRIIRIETPTFIVITEGGSHTIIILPDNMDGESSCKILKGLFDENIYAIGSNKG